MNGSEQQMTLSIKLLEVNIALEHQLLQQLVLMGLRSMRLAVLITWAITTCLRATTQRIQRALKVFITDLVRKVNPPKT